MSKSKDAAPSAPQEILPPAAGTTGPKGGKAAERDPEFEGLMSEIESDLREEELRKLWQRYGKLVLAVFALILLTVTGYQLWHQRQTEHRDEIASRYDAAQSALSEGKTDDAAAIFADVAKNRGEGYGTLAEFNRAGILLQKKDVDGAVAIYKAIAADPEADRVFRDLAGLFQVLNTLDRDDPKTLEPLLTPLTNPANPLHNVALELSALLAAKEGDYARASQLANQVANDATSPQDVRQRTQDLAAYYKARAATSQTASPAPPPPSSAPSAPPASAPPASK